MRDYRLVYIWKVYKERTGSIYQVIPIDIGRMSDLCESICDQSEHADYDS